jgi:hypothetical protein
MRNQLFFGGPVVNPPPKATKGTKTKSSQKNKQLPLIPPLVLKLLLRLLEVYTGHNFNTELDRLEK